MIKKCSNTEIQEFVKKPIFDRQILLEKDILYPKITIVTPSYNQAEFLERTILSILNQNYPNLEFIIIDGGSNDGSVDIIKKYENYLSYWTSEKDKGQADAINKGFKMATGELIAWQNSDDIYLPGAFSRIASEYMKKLRYDVFFGNAYLIDRNDCIIKEMRYIPFSLSHLVYSTWNLTSQAVFWKKEIFLDIGYLDETLNVLFDWDWFIRIGKTKIRFKFIRQFVGAYRIHEFTKLSCIKNRDKAKAYIIKKNNLSDNKAIYHLIRNYILLRRFFYYLKQGDYGYLFDGFRRRITKHSKMHVIKNCSF